MTNSTTKPNKINEFLWAVLGTSIFSIITLVTFIEMTGGF